MRVVSLFIAVVVAWAQHPAPIASISVCSSGGTGGRGSCPSGLFDTHQAVADPGGGPVNQSSLSVGPAPDEHSTVFSPGTLAGNSDYLFFLGEHREWQRRDWSGSPFWRYRTR